MKKVSLFLAVSVFLIALPAWAREEAPPAALGLNPLQEKLEGPSLPFEFSFDSGKLSDARTGKIFTTGFHAPDFTLPSLKEDPAPIRYPRWAVQEGWEGTFEIAVEILTTGNVGRWKVMESTGYSLLDKAAIQAIHQWHFHPGMEKGQPAVICIQIPIYFRLEEKSAR